MTTAGFLGKACAQARARAAAAARDVPLAALRARAEIGEPPASLADALSGPDVAVIAEVKRSSPSRGAIASIPDAGLRARAYARGGAAAVSVLTEPRWFSGSLEDLAAAVATGGVPALRKDFVVDPYQVWEARAAGASAVLLIVAALEDGALVGLWEAARAARLEAVVEVHDPEEAGRAATAHARVGGVLVAGVNARDLATLEVDRDGFAAVRAALPPDALAVAESGVAGPGDVERLGALGADAVLVGEHVAAAPDPTAAVRSLVAAGRRPPDPEVSP